MLSNRSLLAVTAITPILWGTTYLTTTTFLPADRPLLAATLRALPAGLILLLLSRRLPRGAWWWKSWVLGFLNISGFFALLFIAAYRLPGGVAAVVGGLQPLVVAFLASRLLQEKLRVRTLIAGVGGIFGVCLIVLSADSRLDPLGLVAAGGGALSMALGIILTKRWDQPAPPLTTTAWQLVAGGLTLVIALLLFEGLPAAPLTLGNLAGYAYLSLIGTALAYLLWFRGLARLPATSAAFLGLLSPVVALLLGLIVKGEALALAQLAGVAIVLASVTIATLRRPPA